MPNFSSANIILREGTYFALCSLFLFFASDILFPNSEGTTLKGNLSNVGLSLLFTVILHLGILHDLRFFEQIRGLVVNCGRCMRL